MNPAQRLAGAAAILVSASTALPAQDAPAAGKQLLENPRFEDGSSGWVGRAFEIVDRPGYGGTGRTALLGGADPASQRPFAALGVVIAQPPTERSLTLVAHVRAAPGEEPQELDINAFAYAKDNRLLGTKTTKHRVAAGDWVEKEIEYAVPSETASLHIWFAHTSAGQLEVSDATLTVGDRAEPNLTAPPTPAAKTLNGPGVLHAEAWASVRGSAEGETGVVTFPIPNRYAQQVPLSFEVVVEPRTALRSWRWRPREDGRNLLCEIEVKAPPDGDVQVGWQALVLVGARTDGTLPKADKPANPDAARPWTRSTACVQSDDPAIVAVAEELGARGQGVGDFVEAVLRFTSTHCGTDADATFDSLDAKKALACGGSCTSRANLCAALLRAGGIAARTQAHLPTWSGPLYEHWLVEYWHPGAGWTWVESTKGELRPPPWSLVVINTANPEDEDEAFHQRIRRSGVLAGVALWAVHDIAQPLVCGRGRKLNAARVVAPLATDAELTAAAEAAFANLRKAAEAGDQPTVGSAAIEAAVQAGDRAELVRLLTGAR